MAKKFIVTMREYETAYKRWIHDNPSSDGKDNRSAWWRWLQMGGNYTVDSSKDELTVPKISYRRIKALQSPHWKALLKAMEIQDANP